MIAHTNNAQIKKEICVKNTRRKESLTYLDSEKKEEERCRKGL